MSEDTSPEKQNQTYHNHPSVDQSDRTVPRNLRQTGDPGIEVLVSTRAVKSPFFHKSFVENGAWRATMVTRMFHPRGFIKPEDGGQMAEYDPLTNKVTIWDVAVERQIRVRGPDAEALTNYVITRDATEIDPMEARYVILCNEEGNIIKHPVLLRPAEDEFWFSSTGTYLVNWLEGVNVGEKFDVEIDEIDVAPMQIQGPLSKDVMVDVVGEAVSDIEYYGLMETEINGCEVLVSQTGFSGEKGYEVYVKDATENADLVWDPVHETVVEYGGMQIAPGHHRRIAAGILAWGQDMDRETSPFQVNLGYQVPDDKEADYIGKEALERQKELVENGEYPFTHKLIGLKFGGEQVIDYPSDFWLVSDPETGNECGYITSAWYNPDLETNIGLGYVPAEKLKAVTNTPLNDDIYDEELDLEFQVHLPDEYAEEPGEPVHARVARVPFKESAHPSAREQAKMNADSEPAE